jgi:uncharacterized protein YeaO (DUF488 family)
MPIALKRVYEPPSRSDGTRILVERLWPRGLAKADAAVDLWLRDVAPSTELRKWFGHDPDRWEEFRERYFAELDAQPEAVAELREAVAAGPVTFVFASREERYNNAVALKAYVSENPA